MVFSAIFDAVSFGVKFTLVFGGATAAAAYMHKPPDAAFDAYIEKLRAFVKETDGGAGAGSASGYALPSAKAATQPTAFGKFFGSSRAATLAMHRDEACTSNAAVALCGDIISPHFEMQNFRWFIQDLVFCKLAIVRPVAHNTPLPHSVHQRHFYIGLFHTWMPIPRAILSYASTSF